jgi:hypothetical protein
MPDFSNGIIETDLFAVNISTNERLPLVQVFADQQVEQHLQLVRCINKNDLTNLTPDILENSFICLGSYQFDIEGIQQKRVHHMSVRMAFASNESVVKKVSIIAPPGWTVVRGALEVTTPVEIQANVNQVPGLYTGINILIDQRRSYIRANTPLQILPASSRTIEERLRVLEGQVEFMIAHFDMPTDRQELFQPYEPANEQAVLTKMQQDISTLQTQAMHNITQQDDVSSDDETLIGSGIASNTGQTPASASNEPQSIQRKSGKLKPESEIQLPEEDYVDY